MPMLRHFQRRYSKGTKQRKRARYIVPLHPGKSAMRRSVLFGPEGDDGVDGRGAAGGEIAGQESDQEKEEADG